MNRETILRSPEYWLEAVQNELFRQVVTYIETEGITRSEFAERLGVSKGYISQVLNGNFNYTIAKLIELSLAVGKVPIIQYRSVESLIENEGRQRQSSDRPKKIRRTKRKVKV